MYIKPIQCPKCRREGRPGEINFQYSLNDNEYVLRCECGHSFPFDGSLDQMVLSDNFFMRIMATSNHNEQGKVSLIPGIITEIKFSRKIDVPCSIIFSPNKKGLQVRAIDIREDKCNAISSFSNVDYDPKPIEVPWFLYGLVGIDDLPVWYVHFYSAIANASWDKQLYKPALLDYAVSFEVFIESFCQEKLEARLGEEVASYLLKRVNRIEDRVKDLLQLACGFSLTERSDVYQPWDENVRKPRNRLAHGDQIRINRDDVERAHSAVYQAVRWIEDKSKGGLTSGSS